MTNYFSLYKKKFKAIKLFSGIYYYHIYYLLFLVSIINIPYTISYIVLFLLPYPYRTVPNRTVPVPNRTELYRTQKNHLPKTVNNAFELKFDKRIIE